MKKRKARHSDGSFRNNNKPSILKPRSMIARWVESETVRMKLIGASYSQIARHCTRVGRGEEAPLTPVPAVQFPRNYKISKARCVQVYNESNENDLDGSLTPEEKRTLRKLWVNRAETWLMPLAPAIGKGDALSVNAAIRVGRFIAGLVGLNEPTEGIITGKNGEPLFPTPNKIPDAEIDLMLSRLNREERMELSRLHDKMTGRAVEPEGGRGGRLNGPQTNVPGSDGPARGNPTLH